MDGQTSQPRRLKLGVTVIRWVLQPGFFTKSGAYCRTAAATPEEDGEEQ